MKYICNKKTILNRKNGLKSTIINGKHKKCNPYSQNKTILQKNNKNITKAYNILLIIKERK